jgi:hypothetical protein
MGGARASSACQEAATCIYGWPARACRLGERPRDRERIGGLLARRAARIRCGSPRTWAHQATVPRYHHEVVGYTTARPSGAISTQSRQLVGCSEYPFSLAHRIQGVYWQVRLSF